jgi:hypothetical protein
MDGSTQILVVIFLWILSPLVFMGAIILPIVAFYLIKYRRRPDSGVCFTQENADPWRSATQ